MSSISRAVFIDWLRIQVPDFTSKFRRLTFSSWAILALRAPSTVALAKA